MMADSGPAPVPDDYDSDPERFQVNQRVMERYALQGDVFEGVADFFVTEARGPVLDVGCGEGRLLRPLQLRGVHAIALDHSLTMLLGAPQRSRVQADAQTLPFPDGSFGAAAALYMLYHLAEPRKALSEIYRVLRAGGLFATSAPSRYNDPELASILPPPVLTFDAENGPPMVAEFFEILSVQRWDKPLLYLPDREAVRLYLRGFGLAVEEIEQVANALPAPLTLTKRGMLLFGRKKS